MHVCVYINVHFFLLWIVFEGILSKMETFRIFFKSHEKQNLLNWIACMQFLFCFRRFVTSLFINRLHCFVLWLNEKQTMMHCVVRNISLARQCWDCRCFLGIVSQKRRFDELEDSPHLVWYFWNEERDRIRWIMKRIVIGILGP